MKPRNMEPQPQNELFKVRLTGLLDMSHPLCRLSTLIDWQQLDEEIAPNFSDQGAPAWVKGSGVNAATSDGLII